MFDMATATSNLNVNSPMAQGGGMNGGLHPIVGNLTPQSTLKYEMHSPSHSPMSTPTPSSTPNSMISNSNGKSGSNTSNKDELFGSKCKRKINFSHLGIPKGHHQPATVQRRNARERNRVKQVNNGFAALKQHIPLTHRSKKMSKVETLKCAVDYIRELKIALDHGAMLTSPTSSHSESESDNTGATQFGQAFVEAFSHSQHFSHFSTNGQSNNTTTVPAGSHQLSPSSSEDPSSPSYASEASSYITSSNTNNANNNNMQYDYENYEPVSPEDEELLDAISWWQQS